jgi:DNA-binding response OmpR family regulator
LLQSLLTTWGYTVTSACDGNEAWQILSEPEHPHLVILDGMMPGIEGPEIVRRLRERELARPYYAIIVTSHSSKYTAANVLNSGADDFIWKPFDSDELRARVAVGYRMNVLQKELSEHNRQLEQTLARVKQLEGIIPICTYCKKIRDDQKSWHQLETYISDHSEAVFSHGACPACLEEQLELIKQIN